MTSESDEDECWQFVCLVRKLSSKSEIEQKQKSMKNKRSEQINWNKSENQNDDTGVERKSRRKQRPTKVHKKDIWVFFLFKFDDKLIDWVLTADRLTGSVVFQCESRRKSEHWVNWSALKKQSDKLCADQRWRVIRKRGKKEKERKGTKRKKEEK